MPCCGDWTGRPAKLEIEDDAHISGACSARWRYPVRCEATENPNGQNVVKAHACGQSRGGRFPFYTWRCKNGHDVRLVIDLRVTY